VPKVLAHFLALHLDIQYMNSMK